MTDKPKEVTELIKEALKPVAPFITEREALATEREELAVILAQALPEVDAELTATEDKEPAGA